MYTFDVMCIRCVTAFDTSVVVVRGGNVNYSKRSWSPKDVSCLSHSNCSEGSLHLQSVVARNLTSCSALLSALNSESVRSLTSSKILAVKSSSPNSDPKSEKDFEFSTSGEHKLRL